MAYLDPKKIQRQMAGTPAKLEGTPMGLDWNGIAAKVSIVVGLLTAMTLLKGKRR